MLERFNTTTRLIIAICLAVVIWIAGVIIGQEQTVTILNPEGGFSNIINRNPSIKVSLMVDQGGGRVAVYQDQQLNYGQTVYQLLEKINQVDSNFNFIAELDQQSGELKNFSLAGLKNTANGASWLLWVNNQLRTEPLNQVKLKARDVVEIKFVKLISNL
ncbi:MAG: hypothetical protein Q8P32_03575 [Candidatus Komeilibacteria bacterium]|nr:hypothetical protein [Candidatus Komeilibacteria bacterium]